MSLFRLPALRSIASRVGFWGNRRGVGRPGRSVTERSFRHLVIDPLEQRQLLSLSPMSPYDKLVNETFGGVVYDSSNPLIDPVDQPSQWTLAGQSVACDADGDFVVTWTRYDAVLDPDTGQPVIDPVTGLNWTDANIYARYFTDEVQRLTLPTALATDVISGAYGKFSLNMGGNEIQKISITATYKPYVPNLFEMTQPLVTGQFQMGLDVNGDGMVAPGETFMVAYDETTIQANADAMQLGLQGLGGPAADVRVEAVSAQEYLIHFGNASAGRDMREIVIDPAFVNFTTGFYPAVLVSTVNQPQTIANIPVSPTDANATARVIEQMFLQTMKDYHMGPIDYPPDYRIPGVDYSPDIFPQTQRYADWRVSVRPVNGSLTQFDVTFTGAAGKTNQPLMVVSKAVDELNNSYLASPELNVLTIKEPSPEFRVNDPEPDDPFTPFPDVTNQTAPAVALDADGDFVITWQSEILGAVYDLSNSDIYARRFKAVGWVEDPVFKLVGGAGVQSVLPLGNQFRVNTFTVGIQDQAAIGMDRHGNFTICWVGTGQDISHFNKVSAQRYNREGAKLGSEFVVMGLTDDLDTSIHHDPYVSMSDEGYVFFTWTETDDPYYTMQLGYAAAVIARLFSPDLGLTGAWFVGGGGASTSDWDSGNNFLVSWDVAEALDTIPGGSENVYAEMYAFDGQFIYVTHPRFRVNSASLTSAVPTAWPGDQFDSQAMLDADGDILVTYEGYGADVSEAGFIFGSYFTALVNSQRNADLLPFFNPLFDGLFPVISAYGATPSLAGGNGDIDAEIEDFLIGAYNSGATDEQIGRLRAVLDLLGATLRGEGWGILFSRFDALPDGTANELYSDCVANAYRDGHNTRYVITLDPRITGGSFTVRVTHGLTGRFRDIVITPPLTGGTPSVIDPNPTAGEIETQLETNPITGDNWDYPSTALYDGPVEVRRVDRTGEYFSRANTPWGFLPADGDDYVYEITFQGECHDVEMFIEPAPGRWNRLMIDSDPAPDPLIYFFEMGEWGIEQSGASASMQPDGDFVVAWTQWDQNTDNFYSNTSIYFREFDESTDTAGPRLTDFLLPDGSRLTDGGQVVGALQHIVVTFDEELTAQNVNSVLDTANWALMKDGVEIRNGISKVYFGMNMAATMAGLLSGDPVGSNKWEAVLVLDANGSAAGSPALGDGNYQIVAKNSLRDMAGNPLERTGYLINGQSVSRDFYVTVPTGTETPVNTQKAGSQQQVDTGIDPDVFPNSPQSIAGDADGDHVVVWTDKGSQPGVYAKLYRTEWTKVGTTTRVSNVTVLGEIRVTDDPTAMYASVARDGDGDFVVTWSAEDSTGDWNVWYRRYDSMGRALTDAKIVNTELEGIQRFSTVAMDVDGDFVVTWQSQGQDESGYGVYAQRFTRAGDRLGGLDEIQVVRFVGDVQTATFTLDLDGQVTGAITYTGSLEDTAAEIESRFAALGITVETWVMSKTGIAIRFIGDYGRTDQPPLLLGFAAVSGGATAAIKLETEVEGEISEFRVNDVTQGDQMFPSIAMDSDGSFVISWTSYGQGPLPYESDIYAKQFPSNDVFLRAETTSNVSAQLNSGAIGQPRIITPTDDPNDVLVPAGTGFDGVVMVTDVFGGMGSGSLLTTGRHILTAAHVVVDAFVNPLLAAQLSVVFDLPGGPATVPVSQVFVHPNYDGNILNGSDLAVLVLADVAPAAAERYDIFRLSNEIGQVFDKYGFGATGTGNTGEDPNIPSGIRRGGQNRYESTGALLGIDPGILVFDFDNGNVANDALGVLGLPDTGVGTNPEVNTAHGDSGGPGFVNGLIAGVTSGGFWRSDIDTDVNANILDSSFGEISIDVRVSAFAPWIDAIVAGSNPEFRVNTTIAGDQKWSAVAMDSDGDFVITWTSYGQDGTGTGYGGGVGGENGIYAQRFQADAAPVGPESLVNTFTESNQQHSSVAMDADGDFIVAWESFQEPGTGGIGPDSPYSYGVYAQRYVRNELVGSSPTLGPNGRLGGELHVNSTLVGQQRFPAVTMDHTGDAVIVWSGNGPGDTDGIFLRRFEVAADVAGPVVTDLDNVTPTPGGGNDLDPLVDNDTVFTEVTRFVVTFGENLNIRYADRGAQSVLNPDHWVLMKLDETGTPQVIEDGVALIEFGLNQAFASGLVTATTNKYEAIVTFDSDATLAGQQALADGQYVLTILDNITDLFDSALDGDYDGAPGGDYQIHFTVLTSASEIRVNADPPGDQDNLDPDLPEEKTPNSPQTTVTDADGDYIVVWQSLGANTGIYVKLYDAVWLKQTDGDRQPIYSQASPIDPATGLPWPRKEILVTSDPNATYASVACDADGDFVVTWTVHEPVLDPITHLPVIDPLTHKAVTNADVFARRYTAAGEALGDAFRVNTETADNQLYSTVAMDHDGDFVIAWQSDGQNGNGFEVYAQRYNRFGEALGVVNEHQAITFNGNPVGTFTLSFNGAQTAPIGYSGDTTATAADVKSKLEALGLEVEVEAISDVDIEIRFVGADGGKNHPPILLASSSVTGDPRVEIVVTTAQDGQAGEMLVNQATEGDQLFPSAAMDAHGNFVVTWTSFGQDGDSAEETNVYARMFVWVEDVEGEHEVHPGGEFRVNDAIAGSQRWSDVALDMQGDFVITWTSVVLSATETEEEIGVDGQQDVMARRFLFQINATDQTPVDPPPAANEFQVNTYNRGTQQHSSISMDADGDFIITWESFQDRPMPPLGLQNVPNSYGIFAQRYVRRELWVLGQGGPNGEQGGETPIHGTTHRNQRFPGVALDDTGDFLVVWSGNGELPGQVDDQGIFHRRFAQAEDVSGPTATDVHNVHTSPTDPTSLDVVPDGGEINSEVTRFVVTFGEDLNVLYGAAGAHSVLNPDFWVLTKNGDVVPEGVYSIVFGLNKAYALGLATTPSGKYEAVVTFDMDAMTPGQQALTNGHYVLGLKPDVQDLFGNPLDGNLDGVRGDLFEHEFIVLVGEGGDTPIDVSNLKDGRTYPETPGAVAVDADGDHIIAWTAMDTSVNRDRVFVRTFDSSGVPTGSVLAVTPLTEAAVDAFDGDVQRYASVACDADGDFLVTWTNYRGNAVDVYARRYDANGTPRGLPFRVNCTTAGNQKWSNVAMDVDGDFVITWSSYGQEDGGQNGFGYGVYARRYDSFGRAYGPEFRVNTTTGGNQQFSSVTMDAIGAFVIVWQSDQNGVGDDIVGRAFNADGSPSISPLAGEFIVNDTTAGNQRYPDVSMNLSGDTYVVTWSSSQGTDDQSGYGVYTKTFNRITATEQNVRYAYDGDPIDFAEGQTISVPIVVDQAFQIRDVNVRLTISHEDPSDLFVWLVPPWGDPANPGVAGVLLFSEVPREGDEDGSTASGPNGVNFNRTLLDDEADVIITSWQDGALPPFDDAYRPEELLGAFDNQNALGTWTLVIQDRDPPNDPDIYIDADGIRHHDADGGRLRGWSLDFLRDPAASSETIVNTTRPGNQMYSSVAMDHQGNFVVTWCGYGEQEDQEDTSDYGVFAQRFNAAASRQGDETRLNATTDGMQWIPSVGSDGEGNFVAVWTGVGAAPGTTNVFSYISANHDLRDDLDGPIVTGVELANGTALLDGGVVAPDLTTLTIAFGEDLSVRQTVISGKRTPALESVLNPNNWILEHNGSEILGGISKVTFGWNPAARQYEAEITLDGNGLSTGTEALQPGDYTLVVRDLVEDLRGNNLDGDFDGAVGTAATFTGHSGYQFHFSVSQGLDVLGPEMRVNQTPELIQILSQPQGTGFAREVTGMSVAVDHDGDYAVVWTAYSQDDPSDTDVYFRLYNRNNEPMSPQTQVNFLTAGNQREATVAMDADGDFVVVWQSQSSDGTWDVYAQRFDALGHRIANKRTDRLATDPYRNAAGAEGIEVLVNTTIVGEQFNPAVAMDSYGNYIIVWGNAGQGFSYFHTVEAQRFSYRGEPMGVQFQVNATDLPGANGPGLASSFTVNPSVDLGDDGGFVVAWDRMAFERSGVVTDTDVVTRVFDAQSNPVTGEVVVNAAEIITQDPTHEDPQGSIGGTDIARNARNPQVAMDTAGNFIVVFEAFQDNDYAGTDAPDSYGIYYRRFDAVGTPLTDEVQQANTVVTTDSPGPLTGTVGEAFAFDQVNPTIAIDADGDFAIFWNGNGAQPDPLDIENIDLISSRDTAGVFGRWFHAGTATVLSYPSTVQQRANRTEAGIQQFPSIAMEPDGDAVVVWAGSGVGDQHGIFVRRYDEATDTAGPMATELRLADAARTLVGPGDNVFLATGNPQTLLVVFDERLNTVLSGAGGTPGLHSVENVNNWALVNGRGDEVQGAILRVTFRFDTVLNKWVAEITFRGTNGAAGPLANGAYTLVARTGIHDVAGNALARTGYQPYGTGVQYDAQGNPLPLDPATSPTGGFGFQFRVNNTVPGNAPWGDLDQMASDPTTTRGQDNLALVTHQNDSAVARNASGQYVVVWVEYREVVDSSLFPAPPAGTLPVIPATPVLEANIMAQQFDASCREVGDPILVNSLTTGDQLQPAVGIDDRGNFVVIWSGDGTALTDATGIFGQRFDADGVALGGQFRVNDYLNSIQDEPAVAMNPNTGDFVVTWTSFGQDGNRDGIYARRYRASGQAYGAEFLVNTAISGAQATPDIAMDAAGNFVIVWASEEQDASGWGIFGQRFAANGTRLGSEFRANSQQNGDQLAPAVARDRQGNFVVTWASRQDGSGYGVYAQRYSAAGVKQGTEFRVNATTVYDQFEPDVAMSADGIFVVTWTSFNQDTPYDEDLRDWGIYARMYNANGTDYVDARVGTSPIGEFRVNAQTTGNQYHSSVSMDAAGHYIVSWTGMNSTITVPDTAGTGSVDREMSAIYSRFIDPPVETQSTSAPADVPISGTSGNDVFEFIGGPTPATWIVKLNGEPISVGSSVGTIRFDGKGGQDTVTFGGSSADDRVELWANRGTFTSQYYTLEVSQVEIITATGGVGADTVILHDSTGNDLLVVNPQSATFTGTALNLTASGFELIQAKADGGGTDTVQVYDTSGNDTLNATPAYIEMVASGYYVKAEQFEYAKGYSTSGTDTANLYDSAGDDNLQATAEYAKLYNQSFFTMATGFRYVRAYGTAGGEDVATMSGSSGPDTFEAHPRYAKYYGATFYHRADDFETIQAIGQDGGEDTAILHGSDDDDTFVAGRHYGKIFGEGYDTRADFFRYVTGYGEGGDDSAQLYDSAGDDTLDVTPLYGQLYGSDYYNRAYGFDQVDVRAIGGGYDVGNLFDSALVDYLEAEKDWVRLSNADLGFAYWASGLDKATAKSSNQGDRKRVAPEVKFLFATGMWQDV